MVSISDTPGRSSMFRLEAISFQLSFRTEDKRAARIGFSYLFFQE